MWDMPLPASTRERDEKYMASALDAAREASAGGDVPVGCVIVCGERVLAVRANRREADHDATAHAELDAIRDACRALGGWRLLGCEMFVTLEPCPMCAGAIVNARIPRVVIGARDAKAGALGSVISLNSYPLNHKPEIVFGVRADESAALLREFFRTRRTK